MKLSVDINPRHLIAPDISGTRATATSVNGRHVWLQFPDGIENGFPAAALTVATQVQADWGDGWVTLADPRTDLGTDGAAWLLVHLTGRAQQGRNGPTRYRVVCGSEIDALNVHTATRQACVMQEPAHADTLPMWTVELAPKSSEYPEPGPGYSDPAFDVAAWLDQCGWSGEAREQARQGFNAGWDWASRSDDMMPVESEEDAYAAGEGYFHNGFDAGKDAYQSGEYTGGVANY